MLQKFTNPDSTKIKLDTNSRLYLDSNVIQLKDDYKPEHAIKKLISIMGKNRTIKL